MKMITTFEKKYKFDMSYINNGDLELYKENDTDTISWVHNDDYLGVMLFTFDGVKIYNLFEDYPHNLSVNEVEIFDRENPYWRDFFKGRRRK